MDIIYQGWEQWLLSVSDHSIDGSNSKTFHSIMGTWTRNGKEDDCSKGGGLTYDSDYEENGDDEKGYSSEYLYSASMTNVLLLYALKLGNALNTHLT